MKKDLNKLPRWLFLLRKTSRSKKVFVLFCFFHGMVNGFIFSFCKHELFGVSKIFFL